MFASLVFTLSALATQTPVTTVIMDPETVSVPAQRVAMEPEVLTADVTHFEMEPETVVVIVPAAVTSSAPLMMAHNARGPFVRFTARINALPYPHALPRLHR